MSDQVTENDMLVRLIKEIASELGRFIDNPALFNELYALRKSDSIDLKTLISYPIYDFARSKWH